MNRLIEKELTSIISPYTDWDRRGEKAYKEDARLALQAFYCKLIKLKPEKEYRKTCLHIEYLDYLIKIKVALDGKDYIMACNELEKLLYFEHILQSRICYNLTNLLAKELSVEEGVIN